MTDSTVMNITSSGKLLNILRGIHSNATITERIHTAWNIWASRLNSLDAPLSLTQVSFNNLITANDYWYVCCFFVYEPDVCFILLLSRQQYRQSRPLIHLPEYGIDCHYLSEPVVTANG